MKSSPSRRFALITDSAGGSGSSDDEGLGLRAPDALISLPVLIEGENIAPRLSDSQLLSRIALAQASGLSVTTSRASTVAYEESVEALLAQGFEAVFILSFSSALSGSFSNAQEAVRKYPGRAFVVDTGTGGYQQALMVDHVVNFFDTFEMRNRQEKVALEDVQCEVDSLIREVEENSFVTLLLSSLEALRRGGRAPRSLVSVAKVLGLRILVPVRRGKFGAPEFTVGSQRALEKAVKTFRHTSAESQGREGSLVVESFAVPDAEVVRMLHEAGYEGPQKIRALPPVLASHLGAGSLVLSWVL